MTDVLPEKQKLILKGKFLKNDELLLKDVKIQNGSKLLLMGKP